MDKSIFENEKLEIIERKNSNQSFPASDDEEEGKERSEDNSATTPTIKKKRKRRKKKKSQEDIRTGDFEHLFKMRPPISELITKNIIKDDDFLPVKGRRTDDFQRMIETRPAREDLVRQNYIAESKLAGSLRGTQQELIKKLNMINVNKSLKKRPTIDHLVLQNIIKDPTNVSIQKKEEAIQALLKQRPTVQELISANVLKNVYIWASINTPIENRPSARNCHTLTACKERLYLFGGANNKAFPAVSYVFDFDTNRWRNAESRGSIPARRYAHTAVEVNGCIYIVGGYAADSYGAVGRWMNDLHILTVAPSPSVSEKIASDAPLDVNWERIVVPWPRPSCRAAHACTAIGSEILLFGGNDGEQMFNDTWILDTISLRWKKVNTSGTAPTPRSGHSASTVKKRVYIFGGGAWGGETLNDLHILDTESMVWFRPTFEGVAPSPRAGHTAAVSGHNIFIFGGGDTRRVFNDLFLFDTLHMTCSRPTDTGSLPSPRVGHSIAIVGQHLLVFGGGDNVGNLFNDLYALDTGYPGEIHTIENVGAEWLEKKSSTETVETANPSKTYALAVEGKTQKDSASSISSHEGSNEIVSDIESLTQIIYKRIEEQDREWSKLVEMVQEAHSQGKSDREQIILELKRLQSLI